MVTDKKKTPILRYCDIAWPPPGAAAACGFWMRGRRPEPRKETGGDIASCVEVDFAASRTASLKSDTRDER